MLIQEACKACSITKKAVEYYIKQGLVHPEVDANGYRNFNGQELARLKEIAVLRGLGLGIPEIRNILESKNKSAAVSKYSYLTHLKHQQQLEREKRLERLAEDYDIDRELQEMNAYRNRIFSLQERLVLSFPGAFGMYLSIHFGPFLDIAVDSDEKEQAFMNIIHFLDRLDIPEEMDALLEQYFPLMRMEDMAEVSGSLQQVILHAPESYIEEHREKIQAYNEYRNSEHYKTTSAYKLQQVLLEFQRDSGYAGIFIPNMKILSPAYREYADKLHAANRIFVEKFPTSEGSSE
ncbi:MerR family transcriptional regulator [Paenibacillus brevis]|uniref:MerR family transcriptional regulator n=1 Tax=Paenibacillus brevis TaxID=2841508 RepID=A0ABS6FKH2_9BACL|nr:MerR family transcriptional regulator [Paenibacillus brevis]MBU5670670.1 MerR family transcriptional regulator [Paenibacillus brevis]